jgi:hypothetical protein
MTRLPFAILGLTVMVSIIQARDGTLHASYSYFVPPARAVRDAEGRLVRKAIKHAHFNEAWIRTGQ